MFLWFIGASWLIGAFLFQSPGAPRVAPPPAGAGRSGSPGAPPRPSLANLDYRMVAIGSVAPLLDAITGGAFVLHTLAAPVAVMVVVMLATRDRRLVRRRALGVPIGMFLHQILDASWGVQEVFWWPAFGWSFGGHPVPELDRLGVSLSLELVGVAAIAYAFHVFGLRGRPAITAFLRTGSLPRRRI